MRSWWVGDAGSKAGQMMQCWKPREWRTDTTQINSETEEGNTGKWKTNSETMTHLARGYSDACRVPGWASHQKSSPTQPSLIKNPRSRFLSLIHARRRHCALSSRSTLLQIWNALTWGALSHTMHSSQKSLLAQRQTWWKIWGDSTDSLVTWFGFHVSEGGDQLKNRLWKSWVAQKQPIFKKRSPDNRWTKCALLMTYTEQRRCSVK